MWRNLQIYCNFNKNSKIKKRFTIMIKNGKTRKAMATLLKFSKFIIIYEYVSNSIKLREFKGVTGSHELILTLNNLQLMEKSKINIGV